MVLEKTLESPLDSKKIKPVHPKGKHPLNISLEGLMLKLKFLYFGHLMGRANSLEKIEDKRRRGQQRMRWLDGITDSINVSFSKFRDIAKDRAAWHVAVHGVAKNRT